MDCRDNVSHKAASFARSLGETPTPALALLQVQNLGALHICGLTPSWDLARMWTLFISTINATSYLRHIRLIQNL